MSEDAEPVVHRKQFVLGPKSVRVGENWCTHWLNPSLCLSCCGDLRVEIVKDSDGNSAALLGLAVQTIEGRPDPLVDISQATARDITSRYESWAGRWVLIADGIVYPDAGALLGVYYGRGDDGASWASSSPALIAQQCGLGPRPFEGLTLRHEVGISWCPPPWTPSPRVFRLLPSQVLDSRTGLVSPRRFLPPMARSDASAATLEELQRALTTACARIRGHSSRVWMSLSAGSDSRVVYAAAHAARTPLTAVTRISPRMSVADFVLPPRMAQALGDPHRYLQPKRNRTSRWPLVAAHTASLVSRGDALPLIEGHRDGLDGVILGGQCFGVGKVLGRKNTSSEWQSPDEIVAMTAKMQRIAPGAACMARMRLWAEWIQQTPVHGLDWRDRFYIEQRIAGWQSAKEQLYDMQPHERFTPINCARTYALLLSLPETLRAPLDHHRQVITSLAPALARFPVNPPDSSFGRLRALGLRVGTLQSWRQPRWCARQVRKRIGKRLRA